MTLLQKSFSRQKSKSGIFAPRTKTKKQTRSWSQYFGSLFTRKNPPVKQKNAYLLRSTAPVRIAAARRFYNKHDDAYSKAMGLSRPKVKPLSQTWKKVRGYSNRPGPSIFNWFKKSTRTSKTKAPVSKVIAAITSKSKSKSKSLERASKSKAANNAAKTLRLSKASKPSEPVVVRSLSRKNARSIFKKHSKINLGPHTPVDVPQVKSKVAPGWAHSKMSKEVRAKLGLA